jgi:hypothetical protein
MTCRRAWLALVTLFAAAHAASAAPALPRGSAVRDAATRPAAVLPTVDLTDLFNRLTVPLGTVPVID